MKVNTTQISPLQNRLGSRSFQKHGIRFTNMELPLPVCTMTSGTRSAAACTGFLHTSKNRDAANVSN
jgi:hypothetical protein